MEQRGSKRRAVWIPVEIQYAEDRGRTLTVSDDVSAGGVRLVSPVPRKAGAVVEVALHFPDGTSRKVRGRVVRVERNEDDPDGAFPHRVAVAFEEAVPELEPILEKVEELEADQF